MSPKYPADVVDVFLREEADLPLRGESMFVRAEFGRPFPRESPALTDLVDLVATMFFASVATEEGRLDPVGIVYADSLEPFHAEQPAWEFLQLAAPLPFDVGHVAKLASTCACPTSFLVVGRESDSLRILGIATPHSRHWFDDARDDLVRVVVTRPGVLAVHRGPTEVVRYERGTIRRRRRSVAPQLDVITATLLGDRPVIPAYVQRYPMEIITRMVDRRRGGILAILGPDERLVDLYYNEKPFLEAKCLQLPLQLGTAIGEMLDAHIRNDEKGLKRIVRNGDVAVLGPPTEESERAEFEVRRTTERVNRLLDQIARLSTIDGAVVLSHKLDVLAFGAKLPAGHGVPEVFTMDGPGEQAKQSWPLESRGTRHRAAAAFAAGHPGRIAFIVSEDGHAATFQKIGGDLFYSPL